MLGTLPPVSEIALSSAVMSLRTTNELQQAGTYRRTVRARIERVWENVFDWEHLPALHERDFYSVDLIERTPSGWRVRLVNQPGGEARGQVIELRANKSSGRYRVVTLDGPGKGGEVLTRLTPVSSRRTGVEVEFLVPPAARNLSAIGRRYVEMYTRLWDQDEAMMMQRERACLARRRPRPKNSRPKSLGPVREVRARLPFVTEFGGERFRLVDVDGELVAHAVTCPHWLGPLDKTELVGGCIRCPWHGYRFDIRSGASVDGHNLSLPIAPRVTIRERHVSLTRAPK